MDSDLFDKFAVVAEKITRRHLELSYSLKSSPLPLKNILSSFFDSANELATPWQYLFPLTAGLDKVFHRELEKSGFNQIDLVSHYEPKKLTPLMVQEREAREFADYIKDSGLMHLMDEKPEEAIELISKSHAEMARRILAHIEEFEWVGTHHCWGDPLSAVRLFSQIKEMPQAVKKEHKQKELPKKLEWLINWQNEIAYWRQYCAESSDIGFFAARSALNKAAKQLELSYEEIIWLSDREILGGLQGGKIPSKAQIKDREKAFGYIKTETDELIITGDALQRIVHNLVPKTDASIRQFSGAIGSKGFAVGTAFVCFTPQEAIAMKKGEILVVPQTTPDYVVVMKKAGAIITDEGGITCHAAIISRELGIPCVVGTKIGTRVIKTGDLIEVDANKGIVRKLKK
ncbi:hypothetical protein HY989_04975 [Candidatus Micrarchaeota archaeon]|nr:hypothetical protein [Candidatus Micrarchaeota archaeon]